MSLSSEYYSANASARAFKGAKADAPIEGAVRLYCTQSASAWQLQVRGPLGLGPFGLRDGKDSVIAGASLSVDQMKELRDAINVLLRECGEA